MLVLQQPDGPDPHGGVLSPPGGEPLTPGEPELRHLVVGPGVVPRLPIGGVPVPLVEPVSSHSHVEDQVKLHLTTETRTRLTD